MAFSSRITYISTSAATLTYAFSFDYIDASYVKVYFDDVLQSGVTVTTGQVTLTTGASPGVEVLIQRETPTTPLVDFVDGAVLTENDLDLLAKQALHVSIEAKDDSVNGLQLNAAGDAYDANSKKIENLAAPTAANDAARKSETDALDTRVTAAESSITTLEGSDVGHAMVTNASNRWDAESRLIKNVADGVDAQDAVSKNQLDTLAVSRGNASTDFTAQSKRILNLATPINDTDAATKEYVDDNAGGAGSTTLQDAYDNSTSPEILTDATNGALSVKRGSAADTDNVVEVLNNAGTVTAAIAGDGTITTSSTVDGRDIATDGTKLDDLVTLTGVAGNSTNLGTFTNGIIADNETVKGALQDVEDALEGSLPVRVDVHNNSGSDMTKGQAVYVSGTHASGKPDISLADANGASTYPAIGLLEEDIANGTEGFVVISGLIENINTSSYSAGDGLYLSETPGALTTTRPSASTTRVQRLGLISRSHASAGSILVIGAGRSNDVPNEITTLTGVALDATDLGTFPGSTIADNETIKGALEALETELDAKLDLAGGGTTGNLGINVLIPSESLDVNGNIAVTGTVDGRDVATDGTKLDGIESGATADQTDAEIKTAYENNANTNAYTDAEQTKVGHLSVTQAVDLDVLEKLVPKAFCTFDPANPAVLESNSYNVTSITRNGTGDYDVNFTNALSSSTYTVLITQGDATDTPHLVGFGLRTTAKVNIFIKNAAGSLTDAPEGISVTIFENA